MDEIFTKTHSSSEALLDTAIQPLAQDIVYLMGAGEVIDSLAAVVRELVENALDAGATRIAVSLWPQKWKVQVADNGQGMNLADLKQAAIAHTTSKIATRPDLLNIRSLGFRGEALHSIAQLAELEICSCRLNEQGYQVRYGEDGEPADIVETAIAPGSIVTVRDLFHSWPARRQVPAAHTQIKSVAQFIQQLALCHPQVIWKVEKDDASWLSFWPGETAKTLMPQLLRNVYETDLEELSTDGLYLAIGLPDRCHRRKPDWVRIAINGRPVMVEEISQAIVAGFRRTIPRDRYPICFLHLTLPPSQLDWNRHPAKSEIYVQDLEVVCEQVTTAVCQLLKIENLSATAQTHRASELIKAAEAEGLYAASRQISEVNDWLPEQSLSDSLPTAESSDEPRAVPGALRAIAQVHNMYILAEHEGGICLIEQHIAHERVLIEQLQQRWQMVPLDSPIVLKELTSSQVERLQEVGVEIEAFGEALWAIRTVPEPLATRTDCEAALLELSLGANLEAALVATACRTAIRNGVALSLPEMQTLLNQWQRTQKPRTCPHGRPICLTLKESSLAKYFRRSWVIGKSHGI